MKKISVIIPVYNAEKTISRTLDSLLNQSFPREYEIIPVNDGSIDRTKQILEKYSKKYSKIKPVHQKTQGPAAARNNGVKKAKGKYVLFTDSDCVPQKNWISEMVSSLEKKDIVGVQGRYRCLNKNSLIARFIQYEVEERYRRMEKKKSIDFIGSYSAGYQKEVFLKFNGFDEDFKKASGEDPELSYRLDKKGYKMVFNPRAIVKHEHPSSLKDYIKMKFGRGYWGRLLYKKHPEKKAGQSYNSLLYFLKIPLTGLFTLMTLFFLPLNLHISAFSFLLLLFIHLPSILKLAGKEKKFLLLGFFLLFVKNLSTGLGILKGYIDFCNFSFSKKSQKNNLKICLTCSAGGHLTQILQLEKVYKNYNYFFLTFKRIDSKDLENSYFIQDPKRNPFKLFKNFIQSLKIMVKEKPDVMITTGAGVAVLPGYIGKIFGKKLIYIESFSRTQTPSLTGKLLYPIADLFFVQWKKLLEKYGNKAIYAGQVF